MTEQKTDALTLAIFGASGATGRAAVDIARQRGHSVRAISHHLPEGDGDDSDVQHLKADVLEDDLSDMVKGADAVLSCLGVGNDPATLLSPPPLYTKGTEAICDAMQKEGVKRLITISASFVEAKDRGPIWFKLPAMVSLHLVFEQMAEMEEILKQRTHIDWTAVRPGWLMAGEPTDDYVVQADVIPDNMIRTRHTDLADFMVRLAEGNEWRHATPAIARKEPPEASSPEAVIEEMTGG